MSETNLVVKDYLTSDGVQERIKQLLDKRAGQFTTSLMSLINENQKLQECTPSTVLSAAITAASMDLPINPNLGFAYIIPYKNKGKDEAQFQMGYKGFIQLAQRSGQYRTIAATPVYEGQLVAEDPLTGNTFDWKAKTSEKVVGYVSMFILMNGFEKSLYMTKDEIDKHAKKYSQSYRSGYGNWKDEFDSMAVKTVIKLLISKFGPMSTEMQTAMITDQSVVREDDIDYIDNGKIEATDEEKAAAKVEAAEIAKKLKDETDGTPTK